MRLNYKNGEDALSFSTDKASSSINMAKLDISVIFTWEDIMVSLESSPDTWK